MTQPNHVIFFFRIYNVEEDNALDYDFVSDNDSKSDDDNNLTNMFFKEESEYIEVTVEDEGDYDVTNMFKEEIAFLRKNLRTLRMDRGNGDVAYGHPMEFVDGKGEGVGRGEWNLK
ncbi:hypothetical protein QYF36_004953 [Acer negundo]|nr:hypothetical protein QYF36_004953 [Acer negundo]